MTRARAGLERIPTASMATHYAQSAGAGLIITEATQVSVQGTGSAFTPGIHRSEEIEGWSRVTEAVHAHGGKIMLQIWHVGRVSHSSFQANGEAPVSSFDVRGDVNTFTLNGFEPTTPPRALEIGEIHGVVDQYRQGARNAILAGFDGVQIHGANGYLIDQFLKDGVNKRTDEYGGSVENRCRFMLEVVDAVVAEVGGDRTSIRLSPFSATWDCHESNPGPLFLHAVRELNARPLAFLEIVEQIVASEITEQGEADASFTPSHIREAYHGSLVVNGGYDLERANAAIDTGHADAVSFASLYMSNPDLAERFAAGAELNPGPDMMTAYGGGDAGYIDYPAMGGRRGRSDCSSSAR